jgi:cyclopropane fatty-acyl-phospholipid synthase-like methyltransferase
MVMEKTMRKIYTDFIPYSNDWISEWRLHAATMKLAQEYLRDLHGKRVLDIGCGAGLLAYGFKMLGADVYGTDKFVIQERNAVGIEELWKKYDLKIKIGDFADLKPEDGRYDLITAENIIEHLPFTHKEFLEKIYALLAPGGYAILATPNLAHFLKRARMLFGRSPYWDLKDFFINKQPFGHTREFTGQELRWMAERTGFEVCAVRFINVYFEWRWFWRVRRWPALLSWWKSQLWPGGRDAIILVVRKRAEVTSNP